MIQSMLELRNDGLGRVLESVVAEAAFVGSRLDTAMGVVSEDGSQRST